MNFVPSRVASKTLDIHPHTLRAWHKQGKIDVKITPGGQRRYNIAPFIKPNIKQKTNYCYCRVSSLKQLINLNNQKEYMRKLFPNHIIIEDVASGINFDRKGLHTILDESSKGTVGQVVVAYRDRLTRFGFDFIKQLIEKGGGEVVVLNNIDYSKEEELVEDLLSIITVFTARVHGLRRYKDEIEKDQIKINRGTTKDNAGLVWNSQICL
jgi:predicted site-specific integrase-resolvase